jgi:GNAT superfamily N-acetyltransferase
MKRVARGLLLVHCMFHPSTSRDAEVCYLQDLFTAPSQRGRGIGRALIEHVYELAARAGSSRVYWHTQSSNVTARALYDKLAQHDDFVRYTHEL